MNEDAEEAFDSLRGEVALLRRAIEGFMADPVKIPPEVSRQMRAQSAELARLAEETQHLAARPALALTPDIFTERLQRTSATITERLEAPWSKHLADLERVGAQFARYGERARVRDAQRRQVAWAASVGAVAAVLGWVGLSGPVARALPDRWQVAVQTAAAALGMDRWGAGERVMQRAASAEWERLTWARDFVDRNSRALDECRKRKSKGPRACVLEFEEATPGV